MSYMEIFKNKTGIEKEIDDFLDHVSESGLLFTQGVKAEAMVTLLRNRLSVTMIYEGTRKPKGG